jgi:hypothetical protein
MVFIFKPSLLALLLLTAFVLEIFLFTRPVITDSVLNSQTDRHNIMKESPVQIISNQTTENVKYND